MRLNDVLVPGSADGDLLILDEPVSFWGGVDSGTGLIVDTHHPQVGESLRGVILVIPHARGSSGTSSALAELLRVGLGPSGIVLGAADSMITIGALVAERLYGVTCPVVVATTPKSASGRWRIQERTLEQSN